MITAEQEKLLSYFSYRHLPIELQFISQPVCELANKMATVCEDSQDSVEVTVGLRRLLEAKDCFVRAMVK